MARREEYKQRERRYVQEYVNERFPDRDFVIYNVAVGPPPEALAKAHPEVPLEHFRRWRLYADAVVGWKGLLVLVEAKIRKPKDGVGSLLQYAPLIHQTPELAPYVGRPIQMRLVTPRQDPRVIQFAASHDIIVDIFYKDWVGEYLRQLGLM
jgi:hypothetical protein